MTDPEEFPFIVSNDAEGFKKASTQTIVRQHASRKGGSWRSRPTNTTSKKHNLGQLPPEIQPRSALQDTPTGSERSNMVTEPCFSQSVLNHGVLMDFDKNDRNRQILDCNTTGSPSKDPKQARIGPSNVSFCDLGRNWSDLAQVFSEELDLSAQRVLQQLLDNSSSNRFRAYRDAWLPAILPDAAAFEQYLSNFTLHLQQLAPSKSSELDMIKLKLHSNSLQSINRRISSLNVATDEGLIAAVISFVAYYQETRRYDMWYMHMKGLKTIISLQGGLERAFWNRPKLRWILFCVNLQGSWLHDLPIMFPAPHSLLPRLCDLPRYPSITSSFHSATQSALTWRITLPDQPLIPDLLDDLVIVTAHLTAESIRTAGTSWRDSISIGLLANPLIYRLLELRAEQLDDNHRGMILQESFRLAALMFLRKTKWHSVFTAGPIQQQVAKLKTLLSSSQAQEDDDDNNWKEFETLKCWVLLMGAIYSIEHSAERVWFAIEILRMVKKMKCVDLAAMLSRVKSVLWFEDLFGEATKALVRQLRMLS